MSSSMHSCFYVPRRLAPVLVGALLFLPFTIGGLSTTCLADASAAGEANHAKPNVILIVADDLGYGDVGFQGGKEIPTPHIDSIAANGVQFTNGYVSCPVCSPTRAGLATGRYQQRFGHEFNPGPIEQKKNQTATASDVEIGLPLGESTLAEALHGAGYRTAIVGKWHLGADPKRQPLQRGFDEFYGFLGGAHPYVPAAKSAQPLAPIYRNNDTTETPEHLTSAFAAEAAKFVRQDHKQPFFLYLPFNAVHNPLQPDDEHLARFVHIKDQKRRSYAALLSGLDDAIGEVLLSLQQSGKLDNTLVFFISDNGGPQAGNGSNNAPLSGDKGTVLEGGIRVPYAVQWKGKLPAGKKFDPPVISLDIPATIASVAGAKLASDGRPIDGVDLLPYVKGEAQGVPHKSLYWRFGPQHAIRQGDYKLRQKGDEPAQLFNLANDIGEKHDIAVEHPEVVAQLKADYAAWDAQLVDPLWKGGGAGKNLARPARRAARQARLERSVEQKSQTAKD